ncbi:purine catabolism regulatory protein [Pilibacter termitis]|uniref:Purine catabolism regulatory protein n=1 Tax=Pilibacter termitis TaxID=263852 RepID=A0A1T4LCL0_9ENTE|nr:PucR family transcriptional regulator [Pilibacter termitis]SJZ52430.1 purine catabolism regulatory protein [Pilibacter termitis]
MKSLKEILSTPRFAELKVLNKNANLDVPVSSVDISETPDITYYLAPHSLLLTTAMSYKDDVNELCTLIKNLHNLPCPALAIKLGRFIPEISEEVLAYADSLNFPIIQIPSTMTLGDISHKLLSYLWDNQTEEIFFAIEVQKKFAELMFKGASISTLIEQLSSMIHQPLLLVDPFGNCLKASRSQESNAPMSEKKKQELLALLVEHQKERGTQKKTFLFEIDDENSKLITILPIYSDSYIPHLLVIFNVSSLKYPFSQLAIEQALMVLSLAIYKEQTIQQENRRMRLHLYQNLMHIDKNKQLLNIIELQPFLSSFDSNYFRAVVVHLNLAENKRFFEKKIDTIAYDLIDLYLNEINSDTLLLPTEVANQYVLLFHNKTTIQETLEEIREKIKQLVNVDTSFGIGDPVNKINLFRFSYKEALSALKMNKQKDEFVFYNKVQGINRIAENVSKEEMRYFCESILKELAYPKNEADEDLRLTLSTFLDCQCNIAETAEQLYVHRNTIKYRIEKCTKLFGLPVDNPELSLQLRVALYLSEPE